MTIRSVIRQWMPNFLEVAQLSHFALGLAAVWGPVALLGCSPWWGIGGIIAFAVVKEYGFDVWEEGDPAWPNGTLDFAFYVIGATVAGLACWWAGKF